MVSCKKDQSGIVRDKKMQTVSEQRKRVLPSTDLPVVVDGRRAVVGDLEVRGHSVRGERLEHDAGLDGDGRVSVGVDGGGRRLPRHRLPVKEQRRAEDGRRVDVGVVLQGVTGAQQGQ